MGKRTEKPPLSRKDPAAIKATRTEAGERQLARAAIGGKTQKAASRSAPPATMEASYDSDSSLEETDEEEEEESEDGVVGGLGDEVDVAYDSDDEEEEEDSFDFDNLSPEQQKALLASMEEGEEEEEDDEEGASEDDLAGMGVGSGEDDSDMEDDDEEQKEININWDAREMYTRHVDAISGLIDSAIPDGENLVDRHDFGSCLRRSIATTLVTVTELEEEDDSKSEASVGTEVVIEGENTYGVCAFVPVSGFAKRFESCAGLLKLLGRAPEHTLESGTPALRLLQSNSDAAPARALLFVNDHLNIVPPTVIAQVHTVMLEDLDTVLATKKHEGVPVGPASHVVMLARVQRSKSETGGARPGEFDLAAHDFCRWEDEVYFRRRDKRIATVVHRFPKYVEGQEDQDIPRCVVFAIELSAFRTAVAKLTPLAAAVMSR